MRRVRGPASSPRPRAPGETVHLVGLGGDGRVARGRHPDRDRRVGDPQGGSEALRADVTRRAKRAPGAVHKNHGLHQRALWAQPCLQGS